MKLRPRLPITVKFKFTFRESTSETTIEMLSRAGKDLLKNTMHSVGFHNKVLEEQEMWKQWEIEKGLTMMVSDDIIKMRNRDTERARQAEKRKKSRRDSEKKTREVDRRKKATGVDTDRWDHAGFLELEFGSSTYGDSGRKKRGDQRKHSSSSSSLSSSSYASSDSSSESSASSASSSESSSSSSSSSTSSSSSSSSVSEDKHCRKRRRHRFSQKERKSRSSTRRIQGSSCSRKRHTKHRRPHTAVEISTDSSSSEDESDPIDRKRKLLMNHSGSTGRRKDTCKSDRRH